MKLFKKKLNNKGFGHLELLIVIVVVVAVAGTGYFVYQHHKKTGIAHAGSWTSFGDQGGFQFYACKQPVTTVFGNLWEIKSLIGPGGSGDVAAIYDVGVNGAPITHATSNQWWFGVAAHTIYVNPNTTNNIQLRVFVNSDDTFYGYGSIRAGSLVNC